MSSFVKDPDATLDYTVDWSDWLADSEEITSSTWEVASGITKSSTSNTTTTATIWLQGGEAQENYRLTNRITTDAGRTDDRSFTIRVREK